MTASKSQPADLPLCVDLDGTLVKSDTLVDSVLVLARHRPGLLLRLPGWLAGGKAAFKQKMTASAELDVEHLPLSAALRAFASADQARDWALAAGDDYELLLAVAPERLAALTEAAERCGLALTRIGRLGAGMGVDWRLDGREFLPNVLGYDHFR